MKTSTTTPPLSSPNRPAIQQALGLLRDDGKGPKRLLICDVHAGQRKRHMESFGPASDALPVARRIAQDLCDRGWPRPLIGMSPYCVTLVWRCDTPADSDLAQAFATALASQYNTNKVHVRVRKPGAPVRLPLQVWGDPTDQRADHRLIEAPDTLLAVSTGRIELAAGRPRSQPRPGEEAVALLESRNIVVSDPKRLADGTTVYQCRTCPCSICRGGRTFLTITANGKAGLACLTTECAYGGTHHTTLRNWDDFVCRVGGPPDLKNDRTVTQTQEMQTQIDWVAAWDAGKSVLSDVSMPKRDGRMVELWKEWDKLHRLKRDMAPILQADDYADLVQQWHQAFPQPVSAGALLALAEASPGLWELLALLGEGGARSQTQKLAVVLKAHLAEPVHGYRIFRVEDRHRRMLLYGLESMAP